jgi:hypothetical protein
MGRLAGGIGRGVWRALLRRRGADRRTAAAPIWCEALEARLLLSADVLGYHNDQSDTGQNLAETVLSPAVVSGGGFQKLSSTPVDGLVYAQPLYVSGVDITTGSQPGVHNVVFVATENDSLYAIDANSGAVLWQDSFINPGAGITTSPSAAVPPAVGITATPVIDSGHNFIYVEAQTQAIVGGDTNDPHFVQSLYKVSLADGSNTGVVIADTTVLGSGGYSYNSGPYVPGTGAGSITVSTPGGPQQRVYLNAYRQLFRPGLTLANGQVYLTTASQGDIGPYHGWVLTYNANTLALTGVLCTTPNGSDGGIWQGAAAPVVDAQGYVYVVTGNGTFDTTLTAQGFPLNGDYGDSVLKIGPDTVFDSPTNPNATGWGMQVVDYFTPSNQELLSNIDSDLGSGGPLLLPDSAGSAQHPHLLVVTGKAGTMYLIDRDNMGKFNPNTDNDVEEIPGAILGSLDDPAYYQGQIYYVGAYGDAGKSFTIASGYLTPTPASQSAQTFGYPGSSPSISANGSSGGIVWDIDYGSGQLRAYSAASYATQLWNSSWAANGRDSLGSAVKFTVPTVADGEVFVGTQNSLVIYGLPAPLPAAPTGMQARAGAAAITVSWTAPPGPVTGYNVYRGTSAGGESANPFNASVLPAGTTAFADALVVPGVTYFYTVAALNASGPGPASAEASAALAGTPPPVITVPVADASFETPVVGAGQYQARPGGTAWVFQGNAFIQSNGSAWGAASAPDGSQTAVLQGNNNPGSISQTLAFTGGTYQISFQAARRNGQVQPILFSVDGVQVGGLITPTSNAFASYTTSPFAVAAGNHTIGFTATSTSDVSSFLDTVALLGGSAGTAPTVATAAAATPNPVADTSVALSVLGADAGGEANLTYTWATTSVGGVPPAPVSFTVNGSNAAKNTVANFGKAGTYHFLVTITNADLLSTTSSVTVTVAQTLSEILVTPPANSVGPNGTQQFSATGLDQFSNLMTPQPAFTWSLAPDGVGGTIDPASGLYTGPDDASGTDTVIASSGDQSGTATIGVSPANVDITNGLVGRWPLQGTLSDTIKANNGTFIGGVPAYTTGPGGGQALSLTAAADQAVLLPYAGNDPALTISLWVDPTSAAAQNLIVRTNSAGPTSQWSQELAINAAGQFEFYVWDGSAHTITGTTVVHPGSWYLVTATASANGSMTLYVNGVQEGAAQSLGTMWSGGDRYLLGANAAGNYGMAPEGYFNGAVDDVRLYNRALSPGEVASVYSATSTPGTPGSSGSPSATPPTVATAAAAAPNPVTGTTVNLSVLGADAAGEAALTYTWSLTSGGGSPPAAVSFSVNASNAAQNTVATFTQAGTYNFLVTIIDPAGLSVTSSVAVTVNSSPGPTPLPVLADAGFESPALGLGQYQLRPGGTPWVFQGNAFIQSNGSAWYAAGAPDGTQTAVLQGNNNPGSLSQTVTLSAGTYQVSFYAAQRNGQVQPIRFSVDGIQVGSLISPTSTSFAQYSTASFTVAAGSHTLGFAASIAGADVSSFLDSVTISGSTTVTPPTVATAAAATPNPVTGNSVNLSVLGADPAGAAALTYTWSLTSGGGSPPAAVAFSVNASNAAQNTVATFTQAGTYNFLVTITDPAGLTVTSSVTVTVNSISGATPLAAIVAPSFESPVLGPGQYQLRPGGTAWVFQGNAFVQSNGSAWGAASAPDGTQTAVLQGNGNAGSISQSITLGAGTYQVSFYAAQRNGQVQPIRFSVDGAQVGGLLSPTSNNFALYTTATFTVAAGSHTLGFAASISSADVSSFLDLVAISAVSA